MNRLLLYEPEGRRLEVCVSWVCVENILFGWIAGYEGGGCYTDYYFRASFKNNELIRFLIKTSSFSVGDSWEEDLIPNQDTNIPLCTTAEQRICKKAEDAMTSDLLTWSDGLDMYIIESIKISTFTQINEYEYQLLDIEESQKPFISQLQGVWNLSASIEFV
tara:strand:+ start:89 stop:574 length:486 start_codon:yes stop_codon:yes gene_type:complete